MTGQESPRRAWVGHSTSAIGGDVELPVGLRLPDLTVEESDGVRLRDARVGAHVALALQSGDVAIHGSFVARVRDVLSGRGAMVWQERNQFNISFGVFSHEDRPQVEAFADVVARALGATVAFATTVNMGMPKDSRSRV